MSEQTSTDEKSAEADKTNVDNQSERGSAEKRRPRRSSSGESPRRSTSGESPRRTSTSGESSRRPSSSSAEGSESRTAKTKPKAEKSGSGGGRVSAVQAVKKAVEQFSMLTGRAPESVVGTKWEDDHWAVRLEVVESRRIPDTSDLLAEYDVELDGQGELLSYSRQDRYVRGRPTE